MRNSKKVLALILAIAMMATSMMTAFAATPATYTYVDQAQTLNDLGLYKGVSTTSFDADLGSAVDRQTGTALLVRMLGGEAAAAALSDAEVATLLANYTDKASVSPWFLKESAYAVKMGWVVGTSTTTLDPKVQMTGAMLTTIVLRAVGYEVADANDGPAMMVEVGGLTAAQAIKFAAKNLIKDDLVGIIYGALSAETAEGSTIIADLVAGDPELEAIAVDAGIIVPVTIESVVAPADVAAKVGDVVTLPATVKATMSDDSVVDVDVTWAPVVTTAAGTFTIAGTIEGFEAGVSAKVVVTATVAAVSKVETNNLKSFVVTFNKAIDDATFTFTAGAPVSGDNVRLYTGSTLVAIAAKEVAADKKSVTVYTTAALTQDSSYKLTLSGVKTPAPAETIAGDSTFTVRDITSPILSNVALTSPTTLVLTFSEPMNFTVPVSQVWSNIKIDTVSAVGTLANTTNMYKYTLTLNTAIAVGDHAVEISNALGKDYAGFTFTSFSGTIPLAADSAAPTIVGVTVTNLDKVVVEFNESIANISNSTFTIDGIAWNATASGAKATLTKNTTSLAASALSGATLRYTAVKDLYGNSTGTTALLYSFTSPLDSVKPLPTVTLNSSNAFVVEFAEDVVTTATADGALTLVNYKLYDKDGVYKCDASSVTADATLTTKKFTVKFTGTPNLESINPAQYTLKINNIKDMSIISNLMDESVTTLTVNDTKAPTAVAPGLTAANTIKMTFDEAMDATTLANEDNYLVKLAANTSEKYLSAITDATISVAADNKSVTITIPTVQAGDYVKLLGLKDVAGKLVTNLNSQLNVATPDAFVAGDIASIELVALNQVKVKLDVATPSLNTFDSASAGAANNWKVGSTTVGPDLGLYVTSASVASDGKSVTLTLSANVSADGKSTVSSGVYAGVYSIGIYTATDAVKDTFGQKLNITTPSLVADKLAATATVATGAAAGEIKITFNENVVGFTTANISLYNNTTGAVVAVPGLTVTTANTVFAITGLTTGSSYTVTINGATDANTNVAASSQTTVTAK